MAEVTVGQVAGIIAFILIIVQIITPLVLGLLLAGYTRDSETASTWTRLGQRLFTTLWPSLIGSDVRGGSRNLRFVIKILAACFPVLSLLLAIAGIVTPLGLREQLNTLASEQGNFVYAQDTSDILQRDEGDAFNYLQFFDIEWRQLTNTLTEYVNGGNPYDSGMYRQLDSFILDNEYKILEGLVVDAKIGGIGFRNHTVPIDLGRGGTWQEDLLFIEPEVACVNTNLTIEFEITRNSSIRGDIENLRLIDRGGFVNLNTTYPVLDLERSQENPELLLRAYKGAFLNNAQTMLVLNVTNPNDEKKGIKSFSYMNSKIGQEFELAPLAGDNYDALGLSWEYGNYLHMESLNSSLFKVPKYPNPFNMTRDDFKSITVLCSGSGNADLATASNIFVACGLLRGAPVRVDGGPQALLEHGSKWASQLHSCAATVRATIKTVTFSYNGTANGALAGLHVDDIEPKRYESEEDYPLWGYEETGLNVSGVDPLWGLISPEYSSRPNVSSLRQPSLYLPGYQDTVGFNGFSIGSNLPGSQFPSQAMNQAFELGEGGWPFDLLGTASISIFNRWQTLSANSSNAAGIIKLIWTDLAASAVVGTKGTLGSLNLSPEAERTPIQVRPIGLRVTYNFLYGIPAFILLLFLISLSAFLFVSLCFGKVSLQKLRYRLAQVSAGRIYASSLYPNTSNLIMPSKAWQAANGDKIIVVGHTARATTAPLMQGSTAPVYTHQEQKQPYQY
ncbi:unnamed protein product [Parascedosporium putredinis]|uniref:Uncharacterized protein n=1 Tax=Parascedosporium putredinis TaxID=1442378 RepID=A0A9P1H2T6_9PEZI|nr:unnamed protein product [Parascedosporium putredinis]CAI7996297.1 unnamed protein product [Parascedosporium putredinis]